jgi:serine/threonine-protein kinase HipA
LVGRLEGGASALDSRYKSTGHLINGRSNIDGVDVDDLVSEGLSWGMSDQRALATVEATMERVYEAVDRVALPPGTERLKTSLKSLWARRSWPAGG